MGSLLAGPCITPADASVVLEISTKAAKRTHRSLFIVFGPLDGSSLVSDREIVEPKNHSINSRSCDYLATNGTDDEN